MIGLALLTIAFILLVVLMVRFTQTVETTSEPTTVSDSDENEIAVPASSQKEDPVPDSSEPAIAPPPEEEEAHVQDDGSHPTPKRRARKSTK